MSTNDKKLPNNKSIGVINPITAWPSWFIEPTHHLEEEILFMELQKNKHLYELYFTVRTMQVNYIVFRKNFEELDKLHKEFDHPLNFRELSLQTEKGRMIAQDTIIEFTRLLHNFLASVNMLIAVTRRVWVEKQFAGEKFLEIYQKEITDRFTDNVQAKFLENLRNFTLHRTLPLSILELRLQEISEHTLKSSLRIVLVKSYLLEWDKWCKVAKKQFDMQPEGEIDIMSICRQYYQNVTEFHQWLFWQVKEMFTPQINQINSVIERLRNRQE